MFKSNMHIAILGILATGVSCACASENKPTEWQADETTIYANEYGEIHLTPINDTLMRTVFFDNENQVFDTVMRIDHDFEMLYPDDNLPFLWLKTGGIKICDNRVEVHDFAGPAYMAQYVSIENLYTRPFYKIDDTVVIKDEIVHPKGGERLNGIYILPGTGYQNEFVEITGIISKEKFPREYYSTSDGPQGMFSDTTKVYYRLVIRPIDVKVIEKQTYTGRTKNIDGQAAFIWDYADSEAYYLDNHAPWTQDELDKKITLEAVLVQFINGKSVLKSWEIIE